MYYINLASFLYRKKIQGHMRVVLLILPLILLLSGVASAATIHGTIYDMGLDKMTNTVVEVDSLPKQTKQRMLSIDGAYSFNLTKGHYMITASYDDGVTTQKTVENISIVDDGDHVLDLFLFIDITSEEELFKTSDIDITAPYQRQAWPYLLAAGMAFLVAGIIIYKLLHLKKNIQKKISLKDDGDLEKIILILKKHGGRATQKEIRKEIPLSEAKISLMITELENEGRIKKIRKGKIGRAHV